MTAPEAGLAVAVAGLLGTEGLLLALPLAVAAVTLIALAVGVVLLVHILIGALSNES